VGGCPRDSLQEAGATSSLDWAAGYVGEALFQTEEWRLEKFVGKRRENYGQGEAEAPEHYELPGVPRISSEEMSCKIETQTVKDV
jgi:hypothetical protein